jgi:DNA replication protein DnaC
MLYQNSFEKIFLQKANELLLKRENRNFEVDEDNKYAVDFFISYFSNAENLKKLEGKSHKGIYFYGGCGTGKSLFFEILEEIYKCYQNPALRIKTVHTIDLTDQYMSQLSRPKQLAPNDHSLYSKNKIGNIHFEDLGAESKLNHFGNSVEIMSDIIQLRYSKSRRALCKTFITTNLSPEEARKRYSERVYDRMFEMFNFIKLTGSSRRK